MVYNIKPNGSVEVSCDNCKATTRVHDARPIRMLKGFIKIVVEKKDGEKVLVTIPMIKRFEDACEECQNHPKTKTIYRQKDRK